MINCKWKDFKTSSNPKLCRFFIDVLWSSSIVSQWKFYSAVHSPQICHLPIPTHQLALRYDNSTRTPHLLEVLLMPQVTRSKETTVNLLPHTVHELTDIHYCLVSLCLTTGRVTPLLPLIEYSHLCSLGLSSWMCPSFLMTFYSRMNFSSIGTTE